MTATSDLTGRAEQLLAGILQTGWNGAYIAKTVRMVADLLAEVKRLDNEVDERQGEINTIIEHCWHTGIQYDRTIDVDQIDYPIRVIHELRAKVKRLTPREITTAEELAALPNGAVIRSNEGCIWEKDISGWYEPGSRHGCVASDLAIPATVLYLPEVGES